MRSWGARRSGLADTLLGVKLGKREIPNILPSSWRSAWVMHGLSVIVGIVAGFGGIAFSYMAQYAGILFLGYGAHYTIPDAKGEIHMVHPPEYAGPILLLGILLLPMIGGFLSSMVSSFLAPEAAGHGTDAAIDSYHNKRGFVRSRVPFVKALATALTMGSGGSGGREGPIAQIGGGFGSWLGRVLNLNPRQRRILLAAGMGAGVGSIFRAPLAGALFASEVLYKDAEFESDVILPGFISCSVAYLTYCSWTGDYGTLFEIDHPMVFDRLFELLPYTLLILLLVPAVAFFVKAYYGTEKIARKFPMMLSASVGGLATGALALGILHLTGDNRSLAVLSHGYGILQDALDNKIVGYSGIALLLLVAFGKILTTSFTIAGGGSAGVFGPSMVIGGSLGGAAGIYFHQIGWVHDPSAFVVVGMCGFFAGAANTPISTIIMISEVTGSYELLLPAMWVCALTFMFCRRYSLYQKQASNRAHSLAHSGEFVTPLLEEMTVAEVFEPNPNLIIIDQMMPLSEIVETISHTTQDYFPVLDSEGKFVGIFSSHDVRSVLLESELHNILIADNLIVTDPIKLYLDDDLHTALMKFNTKKLDVLPVVLPDDPYTLLGMIPHRAVTRAYQRKLAQLEDLKKSEGYD